MGKVIYIANYVRGNSMSISKELTQAEIEDKARVILDQYNLQTPIDPVKIAKKVGISVKDKSFKPEKGSICGAIRKEGHEINIYVNRSHYVNRKRFTIAHELGHYFLKHLDNQKNYTSLYRGFNESKTSEEKEADMFAAALLMNKEIVIENYKILKEVGYSFRSIVSELASIFKVSELAMEIRIKKLGLKD